jgi:hypothetical protein
MNNLIYEQWHFARPKLAAAYLALLRDGPGDPIALQSPRRWGKTTLLRTEITPAARTEGFHGLQRSVRRHRGGVPINRATMLRLEVLHGVA